MTEARTNQAARNNAAWCDAVCRAHGRPGEFWDGIWINRHETPRFYPNAVTLSATASAAQLEQIDDLTRAPLVGEWAVKDSFCTLDLVPHGFRVLFTADWTWRPPSRPRPNDAIAGARWVRMRTAADLAAWEAARSGKPATADIFRPALLDDETISVFAACREGRIVAGGIANRTGEVVGLSNLFVPAHDGDAFRADCVAAVIAAFPDLPIVGYEHGEDLATARALGFETVGPLRVWVRALTSD
ncbi:MAG: hypothetical protein HYR72_14385 [Deltaproteobacteria bacterium]|nr:hypothetical protein [Deltaproteobacteria bacterium]MBI3391531.1 hypothetical protein [Deltaproteobacteria bacterium]